MRITMNYRSPLGELTLVGTENEVTAAVFAGQKYGKQYLPAEAEEGESAARLRVRDWLDDYFALRRPALTDLPLAPEGTDFQRRVWRELLTIPYGGTVSYGELAARLQSSARAIGGAVGRNPLSILIPCHRVLGSDGSLTGYDGGLERKKYLLALERETAAPGPDGQGAE